MQVEMDSHEELSMRIRDKLLALGELRGRVWSGAHVLHSKRRCAEQKRHWDYNPDVLEGRQGCKPATAILWQLPGVKSGNRARTTRVGIAI